MLYIISMEYQKINLLENTTNQIPKYRKKIMGRDKC